MPRAGLEAAYPPIRDVYHMPQWSAPPHTNSRLPKAPSHWSGDGGIAKAQPLDKGFCKIEAGYRAYCVDKCSRYWTWIYSLCTGFDLGSGLFTYNIFSRALSYILPIWSFFAFTLLVLCPTAFPECSIQPKACLANNPASYGLEHDVVWGKYGLQRDSFPQ